MDYLGLMCNCTRDDNPRTELSPSLLNRALMLEGLLAPAGLGLFLFSPRDVTTPEAVPGFTLVRGEFIPERRPVPRVNANWTYGTRRLLNAGMGYRTFQRWTQRHGIQVYVPYAFAELVSNKRKAYEVVRTFDPGLHPHTADYAGTAAELEAFAAPTGAAFVKPRSGNRGNRIFVLRRDPAGLQLTYYEKSDIQRFGAVTPAAAAAIITGAIGGKSYVVQQGVDAMRIDGSVFDVRVVTVNDGARWHPILESRVSPAGSDLSNIAQGGRIEVTEDLLARHLGADASGALLDRIRQTALNLAAHLESGFPGAIMELGFDFVVDRHGGLRLVEVNSKPGLAGPGSEVPLFDWTDDEREYYGRWLEPHVRHLAGFFRHKAAAGPLSGT